MSKNDFENAPNLASALGIALESGNPATCKINYELYREFFDDKNISDEKKDQVIDFLIHVANCFYDAGFAQAPLGQACGKLDENEDEPAERSQNMVSSAADTLTKTFNMCAA